MAETGLSGSVHESLARMGAHTLETKNRSDGHAQVRKVLGNQGLGKLLAAFT